MRYRFNEFEFDSKSLILTKAGDSVAIRHNEAKLLALLLEQADKVLSKEEILSLVWQGKVVSEQAVFQNISHLRNLFGNQAIKTFPKRGYQWQLQAEALPVATTHSQAKNTANDPIITTESDKKITLPSASTTTLNKAKNYWAYLFVGQITYD